MFELLLAAALAAAPAPAEGPVPARYPGGAYSVAGILQSRPAWKGQAEVVGYVSELLTCPRCPPRFECKKCPIPGIVLGDRPGEKALRLTLTPPSGLSRGARVRVSGWVAPSEGNGPGETWTLAAARITDLDSGQVLTAEPAPLPLAETMSVAQLLAKASWHDGKQVQVSGVMVDVVPCPNCDQYRFTLADPSGRPALEICHRPEFASMAWQQFRSPLGVVGTFSADGSLCQVKVPAVVLFQPIWPPAAARTEKSGEARP